MTQPVNVGDLVELNGSTLMAIAGENPMLFKTLYMHKAATGVVTELTEQMIRVDFGEHINTQHPAGRNEMPRGIPLALHGQVARRLVTVLRQQSAPSAPREMPPGYHEQMPSGLQSAMAQAGLLGQMVPLVGLDGTIQGCNAALPITPEMHARLMASMHDRVPARVTVAQGVLNMYMGMKQYAIWQNVTLAEEDEAVDHVEGENWKDKAKAREIDVKLESYEERLCETAADTIRGWLKGEQIPIG